MKKSGKFSIQKALNTKKERINKFISVVKQAVDSNFTIYELPVTQRYTFKAKKVSIAISPKTTDCIFQMKFLQMSGLLIDSQENQKIFIGDEYVLFNEITLLSLVNKENQFKTIKDSSILGVLNVSKMIETQFRKLVKFTKFRLKDNKKLKFREGKIAEILKFYPKYSSNREPEVKKLSEFIEQNKLKYNLKYAEVMVANYSSKSSNKENDGFTQFYDIVNKDFLHEAAFSVIHNNLSSILTEDVNDLVFERPLNIFLKAFYQRGLISDCNSEKDHFTLLHYFYICLDIFPLFRAYVFERTRKFIVENLSKFYKSSDLEKKASKFKGGLLAFYRETILVILLEFDLASIAIINVLRFLDYVGTSLVLPEAYLMLGDLYSTLFLGGSSLEMRKRIKYYKIGFESHSTSISALCSSRLSMIYYRVFKAARKEKTMDASSLQSTIKLAYAYSIFTRKSKMLISCHFFFEFYLRCYNLISQIDQLQNFAIDSYASLIQNRVKCMEKALEVKKPLYLLGYTDDLELVFKIQLKLKNKECFLTAQRLKIKGISLFEFGLCLQKGIQIKKSLKQACIVFWHSLNNLVDENDHIKIAEHQLRLVLLFEELQTTQIYDPKIDYSNKLKKPRSEEVFVLEFLDKILSNIRESLNINDLSSYSKRMICMLGKTFRIISKYIDGDDLREQAIRLFVIGYQFPCVTNEDYFYHYKLENHIANSSTNISYNGQNLKDSVFQLKLDENLELNQSFKNMAQQSSSRNMNSQLGQSFLNPTNLNEGDYLITEEIETSQEAGMNYFEGIIGVEKATISIKIDKILQKATSLLRSKYADFFDCLHSNHGEKKDYTHKFMNHTELNFNFKKWVVLQKEKGYFSKVDYSIVSQLFEEERDHSVNDHIKVYMSRLTEEVKIHKIRVFNEIDYDLIPGSHVYILNSWIHGIARITHNGQILRAVEIRITQEKDLNSFLDKLWMFKLMHPSIVNYYGINYSIKTSDNVTKLSIIVFMDYFETSWIEDQRKDDFVQFNKQSLNPKQKTSKSSKRKIIDLDTPHGKEMMLTNFVHLNGLINSFEMIGFAFNLLNPSLMVLTRDGNLKLLFPIISDDGKSSNLYRSSDYQYVTPYLRKKNNGIRNYMYFSDIFTKNYRYNFNRNDCWGLFIFYLETITQTSVLHQVTVESSKKQQSNLKRQKALMLDASNLRYKMRQMIKSKRNKFPYLRKFLEAFMDELFHDGSFSMKKFSKDFFTLLKETDNDKICKEEISKDNYFKHLFKGFVIHKSYAQDRKQKMTFDSLLTGKASLDESVDLSSFRERSYWMPRGCKFLGNTHDKVPNGSCRFLDDNQRTLFTVIFKEGRMDDNFIISLKNYERVHINKSSRSNDMYNVRLETKFDDRPISFNIQNIQKNFFTIDLKNLKESFISVVGQQNSIRDYEVGKSVPNKKKGGSNMKTDIVKLTVIEQQDMNKQKKIFIRYFSEVSILQNQPEDSQHIYGNCIDMFGNIVNSIREQKDQGFYTSMISRLSLSPEFKLKTQFFNADINTENQFYSSHFHKHSLSRQVHHPKKQLGPKTQINNLLYGLIDPNSSTIRNYSQLLMLKTRSPVIVETTVEFQGKFFMGNVKEGQIQNGVLVYSKIRKVNLNRIRGQIYKGSIEENGCLFEGQFNGMKKEGFGQVFLNHEDKIEVYRGQFRNGLPHGPGILFEYSKEKSVIFQGLFLFGIIRYGTKFEKEFKYFGVFQPNTKIEFALSQIIDINTKNNNDYISNKKHGRRINNFLCQGTKQYYGEKSTVIQGKFTLNKDQLDGPYKLLYPDGGYFIGRFEKNIKCGKGTLVTKEGNRFSGIWTVGLIEGVVNWNVLEIREKNNLLQSEYQKQSIGTFKINTKGELIQKGYAETTMGDRSIFRGEYRKGKMEGVGMIKIDGRVIYKGEFENGLKNGFGELFDFEENISVRGTFKDDHPNGPCVQIHKNRKTFCYYLNGRIQSISADEQYIKKYLPKYLQKISGKKVLSLFSTIEKTESNHSIILGGIIEAKLEGGWQYIGQVRNNQIEGVGSINKISVLENKITKKPYLIETLKDIKNEDYLTNYAPFYQGQFKNGLFSGFGKIWLKNRKVFLGEFSNGRENGAGVVADWQNTIMGNFNDGNLDGMTIKYYMKMRSEYGYIENAVNHGLRVKIVDDRSHLLELYEKGEIIQIVKIDQDNEQLEFL